jgi:hypothetical protein
MYLNVRPKREQVNPEMLGMFQQLSSEEINCDY